MKLRNPGSPTFALRSGRTRAGCERDPGAVRGEAAREPSDRGVGPAASSRSTATFGERKVILGWAPLGCVRIAQTSTLANTLESPRTPTRTRLYQLRDYSTPASVRVEPGFKSLRLRHSSLFGRRSEASSNVSLSSHPSSLFQMRARDGRRIRSVAKRNALGGADRRGSGSVHRRRPRADRRTRYSQVMRRPTRDRGPEAAPSAPRTARSSTAPRYAGVAVAVAG